MSAHTPRPLHLITNSTASTPTTNAFSPPSPPPSFQRQKRFSMMVSTSFSISSPTRSGFNTTAQKKATRRRSAIGYFPPDSTRSSRRGSLIRRNSLGALSETSSSTRGHVESWTRSTSAISMIASPKPGVESTPGTPARERHPLTLMEKHADLLRFIAQKESKCLELRSQLVMHETELAELKRKWQKIVNKGLERGHHSTPTIGGPDASTIVLDGIKEGVQGMGRLLTAGFSHTAPSSPAESKRSPNLQPRLPPFVNKSHSAKESNSSISTYTTSRSGNTTGRFSQSSLSSFDEDQNGTLEKEGLGSQGEEREDSHGNDEPHVQVLMVRDTGATPTMSPNPEFHQQKQRQKERPQVDRISASLSPMRLDDTNLDSAQTNMIGDFEGQTWTSEIQSTATRAHRRKSREVARLDFEQLDFSSLAPSVLLSRPNISHGDTISPKASPQLGSLPPPSCVEFGHSTTSINSGNDFNSSSTSGLGGLAPMSSIPGFGLTAGVGVVSSPPVSSWVDNMGKKLGQLHRSSTFTKNQKRASSFLSDMTNSVVNVLAPPSTSTSIAQGTPCPMTADSNGTAKSPPLSSLSNLKVAPASPNPNSSGSLLDVEDENETAKLGSAAVLQPVTGSSPAFSAVKRVKVQAKREEEDSDDEEWNW